MDPPAGSVGEQQDGMPGLVPQLVNPWIELRRQPLSYAHQPARADRALQVRVEHHHDPVDRNAHVGMQVRGEDQEPMTDGNPGSASGTGGSTASWQTGQ